MHKKGARGLVRAFGCRDRGFEGLSLEFPGFFWLAGESGLGGLDACGVLIRRFR